MSIPHLEMCLLLWSGKSLHGCNPKAALKQLICCCNVNRGTSNGIDMIKDVTTFYSVVCLQFASKLIPLTSVLPTRFIIEFLGYSAILQRWLTDPIYSSHLEYASNATLGLDGSSLGPRKVIMTGNGHNQCNAISLLNFVSQYA